MSLQIHCMVPDISAHVPLFEQSRVSPALPQNDGAGTGLALGLVELIVAVGAAITMIAVTPARLPPAATMSDTKVEPEIYELRLVVRFVEYDVSVTT